MRIAWLRSWSRRAKPLEGIGRVVIVAPHPDDEVIGCGGLIARLVAEGRAPHVVIMTGGEGSHRGCCDVSADNIRRARHELTLRAARTLGLPESNIHSLQYSDGRIGMEDSETGRLRALLDELRPDTVMVPHWGEGWPDHVNTAKIVKEIAPRHSAVYEYCVWMWYYNVWSLDWRNAYRLTMTDAEHTAKRQAMEDYIRPLAPCGKPWSGVLPQLFIRANQWNHELYFKVK